MKKQLLFIWTLFIALFSYAQGSESVNFVLDGSFDLVWKADTIGNGAHWDYKDKYFRPGTQPQGWQASNVNQKVIMSKTEVLVTQDDDRNGNSAGHSVKMENKFVGMKIGATAIGSNAPAYITLGTPWVYAITDIPNCDGGTLGGRNFTYRPDAIKGYFKRTLGGDKSENAKIIAYSWKGTYTSTVKTNLTGAASSKTTTTVKDQELCILNKKVCDSKTDDAKLIAHGEYDIEGELADWTEITVPLEYESDEIPEKINVILSSSNYWDRGSIGSGNILYADDVKFIYNSKLESLSIGGALLEGFKKDTYIYIVDELPAEDDIIAIADGKGAQVDITVDDNFVKIVVTGNDGAPNQHVYTLVKRGANFSATSIKLNDVDLEGFAPATYSYEGLAMPNGIYPTVSVASDPVLTTVDMQLNDANKTVTIIVTDKVNNSDHTYTLKFVSSERVANGPQIKGNFEVQTEWGPERNEGKPDRWGTMAEGWASSNVTQLGIKFVMVEKESHEVGDNFWAVKTINGRPGFGTMSSNAPGYITLGTPWVYADIVGLMANAIPGIYPPDTDDSDGGTIGGVSFSYQPDSIVGFYKRTYADVTDELVGLNPNEGAKIFAYLWKGTSASMTPATDGNITGSTWQLLIDRDVDILGAQNGGTPAEGIKLVASAERTVNELADWTRISVPLHYVSDEKPEKANVVISSADYFNRANIGNGNTLSADDVVFVYNSKLKSITIDGTELEGFDKNTYSYNSTDEVPALADIEAKADGKGAIVDIVINDNVVTITVKGNDSAENPGNIHTYTLTYKKTVGIEQNTADAIKVTSKESGFIVEGVAADERVIVYTVQGSLVGQYVANGTLTVDGLMPKTIYIVKVGSNVQRVLTK